MCVTEKLFLAPPTVNKCHKVTLQWRFAVRGSTLYLVLILHPWYLILFYIEFLYCIGEDTFSQAMEDIKALEVAKRMDAVKAERDKIDDLEKCIESLKMVRICIFLKPILTKKLKVWFI